MRVILFRGKQIHNGEWVEGSLIRCGDGSALIATSKSGAFIASQTVVTLDNAVDIDPNTISQFTGDKEISTDAEGVTTFSKNIFDGDFIEVVSEEDGNGVYLVFWNDEKCGWDWKHISGSKPSEDYIDAIRIIGNKWDSPELLEAVK